MIEAIKSTLALSVTTKNTVQQNSTAKSLSANPDKTQEVAKVPYVSPYIRVEQETGKAVLQIRDSDTGNIRYEFPTKNQIEAYKKVQKEASKAALAATDNPDITQEQESNKPKEAIDQKV